MIANELGELCNIFRDSQDKSVIFYWMYAIAFSLHIYFDFSGYSDMAIGLGLMFGFRFLENFYKKDKLYSCFMMFERKFNLFGHGMHIAPKEIF